MVKLCRIVVVIIVAGLPAAAANAQNLGVIDQVIQQFRTVTAGWEATLQKIAQNTFGILALIQFAWAMIRLALRRADFSEFVAEIVNQVMFLGLFYWLLTTTTTWGPAIISSFRQAASQTGASAILSPGDVFNAGLQIAGTIMAQISIWHPGAVAGFIICGLVVMSCFAFIVATMVIALVRSYFIAGAGVLFMAFGGSRWTSDIAIAVVRTTLSIGAGLFSLQLIVSIGMTFIQQWVSQFNDVTARGVLIEIGQALVLAVICKVIPDDISRMVGGASFSHGGVLLGAAAGVAGAGALAVRGAASGATSLAGAGAAARAGARPADQQITAAGRRSTATLVGQTARNVASAAGRDIGRRLSGEPARTHGLAGVRIAADINAIKPSSPPPPRSPASTQ
jgi:type IV secretion system protein TrbL